MTNILQQLLDGQWVNPDSGIIESIPIACIEIDNHIVDKACDIIPTLDIGQHFAIICDLNTYDVLGHTIEKQLQEAGFTITLIQLESRRPAADSETIHFIRSKSSDSDALIAVGSGTINDVCKYASTQDGKPYIVFGTAPSMNGYCSANAAITVDGHKKSLAAQLPTAVFLDLDILSNAPNRLIRSGLGDALCRTTCQADWLLSKHLRDTPYLTAPFALLSEDEPALLEHSGALMNGDKDAMMHLIRNLILSGIGMTLAGGSYPASQGEHLIAHTMEMRFKHKAISTGNNWPLHGEQIGVTTLTMSRLQHQLLKKRPKAHADHINEKAIIDFFGEETGIACIEEFRKKAITALDAEKINDTLSMYWLTLKSELEAIMLPTDRIENCLKAAHAPVSPDYFHWQRPDYNAALAHAAFMRDRFTFLDLARIR